MVAPGSTPTPLVITRVGMPSVWLSTAAKTFRARISALAAAWATARACGGLVGRAAGSRGSRTGPPYRPASSWASLIAWTNRGSASQRRTGSIVRYSSIAAAKSPAMARSNSCTDEAGNAFTYPAIQPVAPSSTASTSVSSQPQMHFQPWCLLPDLRRPGASPGRTP